MPAGQKRHLSVRDQRVVLGGGDEGEIDGKRDDRDADPKNEMGNVAPDALVLDHQ